MSFESTKCWEREREKNCVALVCIRESAYEICVDENACICIYMHNRKRFSEKRKTNKKKWIKYWVSVLYVYHRTALNLEYTESMLSCSQRGKSVRTNISLKISSENIGASEKSAQSEKSSEKQFNFFLYKNRIFPSQTKNATKIEFPLNTHFNDKSITVLRIKSFFV